MYCFHGDNPTQLYLESLQSIIEFGEEFAPRGKKIKEIRPAIFEFSNPLNRVTFMRGRDINPFFQLAESFWILSGRADVEWIKPYNSNISQFSDDGVFFNAPYGERLRTWNTSKYNDFIFNPIDQLQDVILKLAKDRDSRQAVAVIYNPIFDNSNYSLNGGKDVPCNLVLLFKIRKDKLQLTLLNRSNDIHWGLFGANLAQFSTIQEFVATSLEVEVGTYTHITDSLHYYVEDYGFGITNDILKAQEGKEVYNFVYPDAPRMKSRESLNHDFALYWEYSRFLDQMKNNEEYQKLIDMMVDPYIKDTLTYMCIYRLHKAGEYINCLRLLERLPWSAWKIACLRFLYKSWSKQQLTVDTAEALLAGLSDVEVQYVQGV